MKTGQLIKQYRLNQGYTQLQLANKLGYEIPQFISLVENGHSKFPILKSRVLSKALRLTEQERKELAVSIINDYAQRILKGFGL